ncbi:hypothetical protein PN462_10825 [Spirulina sp. CS-785/01]|uniref:hypothetical protein n=1 Tax=Spirulina sp. CS-785/01 TaxID=3021716 RepID=UPI00232FCAF6|nr:hypothetical protein [Spirulina sp. CS-785/01]MDB9313593.1 hypothetical protein [Spirulina sp. CS-785/01]
MEQQLQVLAQKHGIPVALLQEAIKEERERIVRQNRRMTPRLKEMIAQYADVSQG